MDSQVAQLWRVLPASIRRRAASVVALAALSGLLELLSLGLVIPVVSLVLGGGTAALSLPAPIASALAQVESARLLPLAMALLLLAFTLKAGVMALLADRQAKLSFDACAQVSSRLFAGYLTRPWAFHLQRNSAVLLNSLTTEVQLLAGSLLALQVWIADALVLVAIFALLAWVEPLGSLLALLVVGGAAWLYRQALQTRVNRWGQLRFEADGLRLQSAQQALAAVKEIRMMAREAHFSAAFDRLGAQSALAGRRRTFAQQLPRIAMEWFGVLALVLLVLVLAWRQQPSAEIVATAALFTVAGFRLIPVCSRILHGLQNLQFGSAAVAALAADMPSAEAPGVAAAQAFPLLAEGIRFESVTCRHPQADHVALQDANLFIPAGALVGLYGDTGAGKSTLLDVLMGLLPPSAGRVLIDGQPLAGREREWQRQLGYVPQLIGLIDDSIRRNIAFGLADADIDEVRVQDAAAAAQLGPLLERLPEGLSSVVGERGLRLSGGERQRIGLARALYRDPEVLVLDEATNALDPETEARVLDAILAARGARTTVLVAHRPGSMARCDRVFRLQDGMLFPGDATAGLPA